MITLYGYNRSRWIKPYWTLKELGVPFDARNVRPDLLRTEYPEVLALNPFAKLPILVDGDFTVFESSAISSYLADKYSEKKLSPEPATRNRALYDQWISLASTDLEQPLWRIAKHSFLYPEEERSNADQDLARKDFLKEVSVLEDQITPYLVGGGFTVADIVMAYTLNWANGYKLLEGFPKVKTYLATHTERASFPRELYTK
jgi:glutathione S-transferase